MKKSWATNDSPVQVASGPAFSASNEDSRPNALRGIAESPQPGNNWRPGRVNFHRTHPPEDA